MWREQKKLHADSPLSVFFEDILMQQDDLAIFKLASWNELRISGKQHAILEYQDCRWLISDVSSNHAICIWGDFVRNDHQRGPSFWKYGGF